MRISSNQLYNQLAIDLRRINDKQLDANSKLNSGQKIERPSDNPSSIGELQNIETLKRELFTLKQNHTRAVTIASATENSLQFMQDLSQEAISASSLALQDNNSQLVGEQAKRLEEILEQVIFVANEKLNGQYLFSGSTVQQEPFFLYKDDNGNIQDEPTINNEVNLFEGTRYRIESVGTSTDFTNSGASSNTVGQEFIYTADSDNPPVFDGAVLSVIAPTLKESTENDLIIGRTYRIASTGTNTDFTRSGAPNNQVGTEFVFTGTNDPQWDGGELQPVDASVSEPDRDKLVVGRTYRIENAGANSDFSTSGANNSTNGVEFTYNGTLPANWDGASLQAVTQIPNYNETTEDQLITNRLYEIVVAGDGSADFTGSGAPANTVGTEFAYNGTDPTWDNAEIRPIQPDYDNPITGGPLVDGKLYLIGEIGTGGDFSTSNALVPGGGSPSNANGEVFRFATGGEEVFGPDTVLYEYVPATESRAKAHPPAQYLGSDTALEYRVAQSSSLSPFNEPDDNANIADFINRIFEVKSQVEKRAESLQEQIDFQAALSAASANGDSVGQAAAQASLDRAKAEGLLSRDLIAIDIGILERSDNDIVASRSEISSKQISLDIANNRDQEKFNILENRLSAAVDVDETQLIVQLTQANNAYNASLQAAARILSRSLLDYI